MKDAFVEFASKVPFYGLAVLCLDHPHVQDILPRDRAPPRHVRRLAAGRLLGARHPVPRARDAASTPTGAASRSASFTVQHARARTTCSNCLAVIAVADELEVPLDVTKQALATFGGVARRFTDHRRASAASRSSTTTATTRPRSRRRSTPRSALRPPRRRRVPAAPLHAHARSVRRLHARLQPGRRAASSPTSTPPARSPIPGVTGEALAQAIREHGHHDVSYVPDKSAIVAEVLERRVRPATS